MSSPFPPPHRPAPLTDVPDAALVEANRLWTISRAFATAAHDINNALQVITGSAELLEGRDLDAVTRRRVEAIRAEGTRAADVVDRLLAYARSAHPAVDRWDVWSCVGTALAMRLASLGRQRISASIVRKTTGEVWVMAAQPVLVQVILDILLWAEEAFGESGGTLIVSDAVGGIAGEVVVAFALERRGETAEASSPSTTATTVSADDGRRLVTHALHAWTAQYLANQAGGSVEWSASGALLRWPTEAPPYNA